jgi:transposase-like protein
MADKDMQMHLRHFILILFDSDNEIKAEFATQKIQEVYGTHSIARRTVSKWLKRFKEGEKGVHDLKDDSRVEDPANLTKMRFDS